MIALEYQLYSVVFRHTISASELGKFLKDNIGEKVFNTR